MTLFQSPVKCSRYVSVLSSFTPEVGWCLPLMSTFVSRLFRWKAAGTVLTSLSLSPYCFSQVARVDMSWLRVSSILFQSWSTLSNAWSSTLPYFFALLATPWQVCSVYVDEQRDVDGPLWNTVVVSVLLAIAAV